MVMKTVGEGRPDGCGDEAYDVDEVGGRRDGCCDGAGGDVDQDGGRPDGFFFLLAMLTIDLERDASSSSLFFLVMLSLERGSFLIPARDVEP